MSRESHPARVEGVEPQGPWVVQVTLHVEGTPFHFEAGQYITLHTEGDGGRRGRHYSIASPPGAGDVIELAIEREEAADGGPGSAPLARGDRLRLSGPHGTFRLRLPIDQACLFIATGTGVSPLRSMLYHALAAPGPAMTLLYGTRSEEGILFRDEFEALAAREPRFRYQKTLSRPDPHWTGLSGYVQDHLDLVLNGRRDVDVYLCGRKAMVEATRSALGARGFMGRQVHFERHA